MSHLSARANYRATYMDTAVSTASPSSLLVMLFERLVLDLNRADAAHRAGSSAEARGHLMHAQDIVLELRGTLDTDGFAGALELAALYDYLLRRLVHAVIKKDPEAVTECLTISSKLADTWRQAALSLVESA